MASDASLRYSKNEQLAMANPQLSLFPQHE
jgi:hypothetical protein